MNPAGARRWIAIIFLLALFLRLGSIFAMKRWDDATPGASRQLAMSLVEHGAFYFRDFGYVGPSSVITPPYPMLLAGLFTLFGPETPTAYFAALALNALLGATCAVATAALLRRTIANERAVMIGGLLVALWPPQIAASIFAQPIVLTSLIFVIACVLWRRMQQNDSVLTAIAFAIAAGFAALLEPAMIVALPIVAIAIIAMKGKPFDVKLRNVAVFAAAVMLFLWPWVSRNRAVHGRWLMTTNKSQQLWNGANENATGSDRLALTSERKSATRSLISDDTIESVRIPMMQIDLLSPAQRYVLNGKTEVERADQFAAWSNEYLQTKRSRWLAQLPKRVAKFWLIDWDHPMSRNPIALLPRIALALAAAVGMVLAVARRVPVGGPLMIIGAMLIFAAMTIATARQTIAIEPLQIAIAAAGFAGVKNRAEQE